MEQFNRQHAHWKWKAAYRGNWLSCHDNEWFITMYILIVTMHYCLSLSSCIVKCHFRFATIKSCNEYSSLYSSVSSHNWDTERHTGGCCELEAGETAGHLRLLKVSLGSWFCCPWNYFCDCSSLAGCNLSLPRPLPSLKPTTTDEYSPYGVQAVPQDNHWVML
jgi:hypothetical protein